MNTENIFMTGVILVQYMVHHQTVYGDGGRVSDGDSNPEEVLTLLEEYGFIKAYI